MFQGQARGSVFGDNVRSPGGFDVPACARKPCRCQKLSGCQTFVIGNGLSRRRRRYGERGFLRDLIGGSRSYHTFAGCPRVAGELQALPSSRIGRYRSMCRQCHRGGVSGSLLFSNNPFFFRFCIPTCAHQVGNVHQRRRRLRLFSPVYVLIIRAQDPSLA